MLNEEQELAYSETVHYVKGLVAGSMERKLSALAQNGRARVIDEDGLTLDHIDRKAVHHLSLFTPEDTSSQRRAFWYGRNAAAYKVIQAIKLPVKFVDIKPRGEYL